jgi:intergrase/recombinase
MIKTMIRERVVSATERDSVLRWQASCKEYSANVQRLQNDQKACIKSIDELQKLHRKLAARKGVSAACEAEELRVLTKHGCLQRLMEHRRPLSVK